MTDSRRTVSNWFLAYFPALRECPMITTKQRRNFHSFPSAISESPWEKISLELFLPENVDLDMHWAPPFCFRKNKTLSGMSFMNNLVSLLVRWPFWWRTLPCFNNRGGVGDASCQFKRWMFFSIFLLPFLFQRIKFYLKVNSIRGRLSSFLG